MAEEHRLSSWKEIAQYLGVDVKTAQRWERQRNLPVHRVPGDLRSAVYSTRSEIEEWLKRGDGGPSRHETGAAPPQIRRKALFALAMAAILAATGAILMLMAERRRPLAGLSLQGQNLVGVDQHGREIWRFTLPESPKFLEHELRFSQALRVVDWKGTDRPDAVAAINYLSPDAQSGGIFCLSPTGKLRWKWRPVSQLLDFDGSPFENSWSVRALAVARDTGRERVFVSIVNDLRWASAVYELSPEGQAILRFANYGFILWMEPVENPLDLQLVLTGISNAENRPFVALIGLADEPSVPPSTGFPRYRYANGPKGLPRVYALLPNSEFNLSRGEAYPIPTALTAMDWGFKVEVSEPTGPSILYLYEFDRQLRPLKIRTSSRTIPLHRKYQSDGVFRHTIEECPELSRPAVLRIWTRAEGWKERPLPIASQFNTY